MIRVKRNLWLVGVYLFLIISIDNDINRNKYFIKYFGTLFTHVFSLLLMSWVTSEERKIGFLCVIYLFIFFGICRRLFFFFFLVCYNIEFILYSNLSVYVCEVLSWRLEPQPLPPTPHKHLYLWSDHYTKGAWWWKCFKYCDNVLSKLSCLLLEDDDIYYHF